MIPAFDLSNVLPPFVGADATNKTLMSPYQATMLEVVERFASSPARVEILYGLLHYRNAIRSSGLTDGFQWLDGSFVENIEAIASRPPGDVDVVTFFRHPVPQSDWRAWCIANRHLFEPMRTKENYKCDAYGVDLNGPPEAIVDQTRYWFGLFSHQRGINRLWKGMVQVQLDAADDANALALLQGLTP